MKTGLLTAAVLLVLLGCGFAAATSSDAATRVYAAGGAAAIGFLLGLGVGERSKSAYCRELLRVNQHLGELNEALCESNLAMMRAARERDDADSDATV